jgi:hypothetical protein
LTLPRIFTTLFRRVHSFLVREFSNLCIGRGETVPWTPRSSDLFRLILYFWGFIKGIASLQGVQNVNELRDRLVRAEECVTNEMLANTWRETEHRLDVSCH